ncbi:protein-tyrosine phosphatase-like protein [Mycena rosella]|uniref:protein-tyrosine-phosphatase n=1 Tax=Mycena rosella TaxID=1033263 RepID=A0AAD7H042_MYCRO|nr:protein-tyrosine phosphatase-like protein [Mycena rosella]
MWTNPGNPSRLRGQEIVRDAESFDAIIDDKLYLGNLSAAESPLLMSRLEITHILSVCPDYLAPDANVKHLTLPMTDDEHFNILQHLHTTCQFIQQALDGGGRVFVHCVMGISRSATVVCAYLIFSRQLSASRAIQFVRKRRPRSRPNYNFIRQLQVFSECNYDISPVAAPYVAWRRRQDFDGANSLRVIDAMSITDRLFLSFDFPSNKTHATALLEHLGVTHIVSITPDNVSRAGDILTGLVHKHFIVSNTSKEALLVVLPLLCQFVTSALADDSRVFLHCMDEVRAGIVICAYLMSTRRIGVSQALEILQDHVPLFEENPVIRRQLELFEQCEYAPSYGHPLVRAWLSVPNLAAQTSPISGPGYVDGIVQKGKALQASVMALVGAVG